MINKGKVSIIVPIYKVEKQLKRCIDSIINQTYDNLEIILVNDGSPDNCGEICNERAMLDKRIKVIHKKNEGLGMARNSGLDVATGEYVVFIDSDDYVKENYIELLLSAINENNADLAIGGFIRKFSDGKEIYNPVVKQQEVVLEDEIIDKILMPVIGSTPDNENDVEREMCVWRNMYKRDLIEHLELRFVSEREYVSEDIFFNIIYFINTKKAALIPECIYYYSDNVESLTNTYRSDRFEKYCKMLQSQIEILNEYKLFEIAKMRLYRTFIMKTKKCISLISCSNLAFRNKVIECRKIIKSVILASVLKEYPVENMTIENRFIMTLIRLKLSKLILILYMIKNYKIHT